MAAPANMTMSADIDVHIREIDFVTRFARQWDHLREILNIIRPIRKSPGTKLTTKRASVELESGLVGEGEIVPYSQAKVVEIEFGTATLEKYAKTVPIEAINEKGYDAAVQLTDDEFLNELQSNVTTRFYDFIQTGTLQSTEGTFQMALAMAQGRVLDRWKKMHKSTTSIVGFVNILDAYAYLGAANITVQNEFGINYIRNFMGYSTLILSSEIPVGKVIATASENIVNYYIDPSDAAFGRAQLNYTTDGETNLIGFHTRGNYDNVSTISDALMGMYLFAEYLDGIAVITIDPTANNANLASLTIGSIKLSPAFDPNVIAYSAATTNATNTITAAAEDSGATVAIKVNGTTVTSGGTATWTTGENTVTVTVTNDSTEKTYTVTVTKS